MQASDFLISNGGVLNPAWFRDVDIEAIITSWLSTITGTDQYVTAEINARAFEFAAAAYAAAPSMLRERDKTASWNAEQFRYWQTRAEEYRSLADALSAAGSPVITPWMRQPNRRY